MRRLLSPRIRIPGRMATCHRPNHNQPRPRRTIMTNRLIDLTATAALAGLVWLAITRLAFIMSADACWGTC